MSGLVTGGCLFLSVCLLLPRIQSAPEEEKKRMDGRVNLLRSMAGVKLLSRLVSQHHDSARIGVRVIYRERMAAIQRNTE